MSGTVLRTVRQAVINGVAFVLIRIAGAIYFGTMTLLAVWSIVHSLLVPPPVYA